jgi:hypothetical protein
MIDKKTRENGASEEIGRYGILNGEQGVYEKYTAYIFYKISVVQIDR